MVRHPARSERDVARDALTSLAPSVRRVGAGLLDFLLPPACAVCGAPRNALEREIVCGACWLRAAELPRPRCDRCGHPVDVRRRSSPCTWCALLPPYVRAVRSAYAMPGGAA